MYRSNFPGNLINQSILSLLTKNYSFLIIICRSFLRWVFCVVAQRFSLRRPSGEKRISPASWVTTFWGVALFVIFLLFFLRSDHLYALDDYHHWFKQSVMRWLDIAQVKARERIRKAVEIDTVWTLPIGQSIKLFLSRMRVYNFVGVERRSVTSSYHDSKISGT